MKCSVKFKSANSMFHKSLAFRSTGELHLQETALILEGYLPKFSVPFTLRQSIDLISEWSTRTIPFSRVVQYRYTGNWIALSAGKIVLLLFVGAIFLLLGMINSVHSVDGLMVLMCGIAYVIVATIILLMGRRTHKVTYVLPNGKKCVVAFSMSRPVRTNSAGFKLQLELYLNISKSFLASQHG